jgi:hypothetical protein
VSHLKMDRLPVPTTLDTTSHRGNRRSEPRHRLKGFKVHVSIPPAEDIFEAELRLCIL